MIIVGLTGGIGSGKTTMAGFFKALEVPVYVADIEAKKLMNTSEYLKSRITSLLGAEAYKDGTLNRAYVASKVFTNEDLLGKLNKIVHPAVKDHFEMWASDQKSPYVIKEVAILFENGGHRECDLTILVTSPKNARLKRVMKRDKSSKKDVINRMNAQWPDNRKIAMADILLENINLEESKEAVGRIHTHIIARISKGWK